MHVDCECNRPSFLATVFFGASSFNGDLSQWDVAKVTTMHISKSIYIVNSCYCDWSVLSGEAVGGHVEEYGRLSVLPWPIITTYEFCE